MRLLVCGRSSFRRKPIEAVFSAGNSSGWDSPRKGLVGGPCCRRSGKWPRRLHRRRTLGANCPAALGAVFEVTAFDGWSLRSPAETALETWPGWKSASEARPHSMRCPEIGSNRGRISRHWKTRQRPSREKLRRSAGAKRRTKHAVRSFRPHGLRSFLAGCCRHRRHWGGW